MNTAQNKYNCLFNDIKCYLKVKPICLEKDEHGYFIMVSIQKGDLEKLLKNRIFPEWSSTLHKFILKVSLTQESLVRVNGIKIDIFNKTLDNSRYKLSQMQIKELMLDRHKRFISCRQATAKKLNLYIPSYVIRYS